MQLEDPYDKEDIEQDHEELLRGENPIRIGGTWPIYPSRGRRRAAYLPIVLLTTVGLALWWLGINPFNR